jgi:hypothetical protein
VRPWQVECILDVESVEIGLTRQQARADALTDQSSRPRLLVWRSQPALLVSRSETRLPRFAAARERRHPADAENRCGCEGRSGPCVKVGRVRSALGDRHDHADQQWTWNGKGWAKPRLLRLLSGDIVDIPYVIQVPGIVLAGAGLEQWLADLAQQISDAMQVIDGGRF